MPQVAQLNQRSWLSLEDYVLQNARSEGFRISVFTGPVFRDDDPLY
ncbi:DNA/RNA non-specific endonuclease, partial [Escherichia coli]